MKTNADASQIPQSTPMHYPSIIDFAAALTKGRLWLSLQSGKKGPPAPIPREDEGNGYDY